MLENNLKKYQLLTKRLVLKTFETGLGKNILDAIIESYDMLAPWKIWVWKEKDKLIPEDYEEFGLRKINLLKEGKDITFLIFERTSNKVIGSVSINKISCDGTHGFLGFWIRKSFMKQGYALESAQAIIRFAFDELNHSHICAIHECGNVQSQKTLLNLGFKLSKQEKTWIYYEMNKKSPN